MIAAHRGYDFPPSCGKPRELESTFNRFGSGITQEEARNAVWSQPSERLQQEATLVVIKQRGTANEFLRLFKQSLVDVRILVADVGRSLASDAVNVFFPILTPEAGALPPNDHDLTLVIGPRSVQLLKLRNGPNDCLRHSRSPQSNMRFREYPTLAVLADNALGSAASPHLRVSVLSQWLQV